MHLMVPGIELMAAEAEALHEDGDEEQLAELNGHISAAFCSLAELYLTDLWCAPTHAACRLTPCSEVDNASDTCRALLDKALQYEPDSVQALQLLGSYFVSMQDPDAALEHVRRAVALWLPEDDEEEEAEDIDVAALAREVDAEHPGADTQPLECEVLTAVRIPSSGGSGSHRQGMSTEDDDEYEDVDETAAPLEPPPYEFRIASAKLLIELGDYEVHASVPPVAAHPASWPVACWTSSSRRTTRHVCCAGGAL